MAQAENLEDDYQKIAHQVSQLRAAKAGQAAQSRPQNQAQTQQAQHAGAHQQKEMAPGECIFCKMAKKEIQSRMVEENLKFAAFLDIQPKEAGHTIIVSKRHVSGMDELDEVEYSMLTDMIKGVVSRMKKNLRATGFTIVSQNGISSGQIVAHFSMHIIPTYAKGAIDLPIMNLVQPQKVPDFVMADTERLLKKI